MKKEKILVVFGPTAVGKTALGIKLAKKFNGEIISGDSLQVYRTLDVGTAKATKEEQSQAKHHLIDIRNVTESYSAYDFKIEAKLTIQKLVHNNKLPIIVGGTGLYLQSLLSDFSLGGEISKPALRQKYELLAQKKGSQFLWEELEKRDLKAAQKIPAGNLRRVIRALEVLDLTGKSIIDFDDKIDNHYDSFLIGLNTERSLLYERINKRVDLMLEQGILPEAKMLFGLGLTQAAQGIGYKEFFPYFQGEINLEQAVAKVKQNSRHFAKRQLTWFKNRFANVHWYDLIQNNDLEQQIIADVNSWLVRD